MNLFGQTNGLVVNNELNFLYANYQNHVQCACVRFKKCKIKVTGGMYISTSVNGETGYLVKPNKDAKIVEISTYGLKGKKEFFLKTTSFKVVNFPSVKIDIFSISKSSGSKVNVILDSDLLSIQEDFKVIGGSINFDDEKIEFSGNIITPELIQKAKLGSRVKIELKYQKNGVSDNQVLTDYLIITE